MYTRKALSPLYLHKHIERTSKRPYSIQITLYFRPKNRKEKNLPFSSKTLYQRTRSNRNEYKTTLNNKKNIKKWNKLKKA